MFGLENYSSVFNRQSELMSISPIFRGEGVGELAGEFGDRLGVGVEGFPIRLGMTLQ
jgi:hypothetical protein